MKSSPLIEAAVGGRLRRLVVEGAVLLANYAVIFALSLAVGGVIILMSGKSPVVAYRALFQGAAGSMIAIANTLDRSTIMILAGLSAVVAFSTENSKSLP